jgi:succinate dehydrogenase/fumarate reductase cytochrome b subunit
MFVWIFHRVSGLVLIALIATKIITGFALDGRWGDSLATSCTLAHKSPFVDMPLLFLFALHSMYGIRTIVVDLGARRREKLLFWAASAAGVAAAGVIAYLAYK